MKGEDILKVEGTFPEGSDPRAGDARAVIADLRLRLHASREQEQATRAVARRLARELALAQRLLGFSFASPPAPRPAAPVPSGGAAEASTPPVATRLTEPVIYHLDSCRREGARALIAGWAFRPAPGWDSRATAVTLLFRHGASAYQAPTRRQPRPDVAAHHAAQPAGVSGGARGLDGAGFTCEFASDSLPGGVDWEITLRLECAGRVCEQPTAQTLRL